jgi:hypothetical protein
MTCYITALKRFLLALEHSWYEEERKLVIVENLALIIAICLFRK